MTRFVIILCSLFLSMTVNANSIDLKGSTYRIYDGNTSIFDGCVIKNGTLIISKGDYLVRVKEKGTACLTIGDNTEVVIDGTIRLAPNHFQRYDIIRVTGNHVKINGNGCLIGDKFTHTGTEGEWGMGVCFHGTNPQYAIDIEPNKNCTVNDVLIDNIDVINCEGGFRALTYKVDDRHAVVGSVEIRNCSVSAKSRYPIHLNRCKQAKVEHCVIDATNDRPSIYANYVDKLKIENNFFNVSVQLFSSIINKAKEVVGIDTYAPIQVVHSPTQFVVNNRIVEK